MTTVPQDDPVLLRSALARAVGLLRARQGKRDCCKGTGEPYGCRKPGALIDGDWCWACDVRELVRDYDRGVLHGATLSPDVADGEAGGASQGLYKQKLAPVRAVQFKRDLLWPPGVFEVRWDTGPGDCTAMLPAIETFRLGRRVTIPLMNGDWIVTYTSGNRDVLRDEDFRATYEEIPGNGASG